MDTTAGAPAWFEHLTDRDRETLERVADSIDVDRSRLRGDGDVLAHVLAHQRSYEAIFGAGDEGLLPTSPFLTFAVVVHRGWADLQGANYVDEWVGPRQRLPVLGGDDLRSFLGGADRRLFLTELLSSYTRVVSGATWVHTARGWRRRRFSELDPVRLASLLEVVPAEERAGVYRRLGDLALFLTGVFPDHTEAHGLGPHDEGRLLRLSGLPVEPRGTGAVEMLEQLGERWYRLAVRTSRAPLTATMRVVAEIGEQFVTARRALNYLTDRYLFARRSEWFGNPA
jgi:hypothetical protein